MDEEDIDGCTCDVEFHDDETTADADLPEATGGVEAALAEPGHNHNEDSDGCGHEVADSEATTDEDLPVAVGGVA